MSRFGWALTLFALLLGTASLGAEGGSLTGPILDEGLTVRIHDALQVPASSATPPLARISVLQEAPDGSGRIFVNDLRGPLHVIEWGSVQTYMDLSLVFPDLKTSPGLASGFVSFAFHPEFATNGRFYTVHTAFVGATPPNLGPAIPTTIIQHAVLTEFQATDPAANAFSGGSRELMRIAAGNRIHNLQEIAFNPNAQPGDSDYGLLYIGNGDYGSVFIGEPEQLQRLDTPLGCLLRIDPLGGPFMRGGTTYDYGIPPGNPFVDGDPDTFDEIYAYGVRNAHRLAWDPAGEQRLFVSDIGQSNVEEVNLVEPGRNFGWPNREGTFALDPVVDPNTVSALPADDAMFEYTYPAAQYDHDEGDAVAGGFPYRGYAIPELRGQFVFGDIVNGKIFYAAIDDLQAADDGDPATTAPVYELHLEYRGQEMGLLDIVRDAANDPGIARADLRFAVDRSGELYLLTKQDGFIRRVGSVEVPASSAWGLLTMGLLMLATGRAMRTRPNARPHSVS